MIFIPVFVFLSAVADRSVFDSTIFASITQARRVDRGYHGRRTPEQTLVIAVGYLHSPVPRCAEEQHGIVVGFR